MVYDLHAVIISRNIPIEKAKKIAKQFIHGNRHFYRITKNNYRFRNIPKTKFQKKTFRSKKINEYITLIYGNI